MPHSDTPIPHDFHTHDLEAPAGAIINIPHSFLLHPDSWQPRQDAVYSVGLHPWNIDADTPVESILDNIRSLARRPETVAIGECGLDRFRGSFEHQLHAFERQALLAEELGMPLIIHGVKATAELLQFHKKLRPRMPWTIHGFRGGPATARQLLDAGFDLSFGPRFNPAAIAVCPPHRLHIETDDSPVSIAEVAAAIRPYQEQGKVTE